MLIKDRVTPIFRTFGKLLNIDDNTMTDLGNGIIMPIGTMIPTLMVFLAELTKQHEEDSEGILNWITDAILYMKGELNEFPTIDLGYNIRFETQAVEEQRRKELLKKNANKI